MAIYGGSVVFLYGASSLYHWVQVAPRWLVVFRKIDHIAIYIVIAGSYTPVLYHGLSGWWRWSMLTGVWGLAILGVFLKVWFFNLPRVVSTAFYVTMGWLAVIPLGKMISNLPTGALILMVAGGVTYTLGAIIYATKGFFRSWPGPLGFHEVFHLFVVAGTICHFIMVMVYLVPM